MHIYTGTVDLTVYLATVCIFMLLRDMPTCTSQQQKKTMPKRKIDNYLPNIEQNGKEHVASWLYVHRFYCNHN